ncbi:MAG: carbamoyl-phosphate synthase large subunit [Candidatus Hydrogenedentota bacterium]
MPKRNDIEKILIIGSGPIIIGQACEFDYSGTQACKVLRQQEYKIVLVNSNPATIMTDSEMADATYIEPITFNFVKKIIEIEKPDAILPTLGGQTGLNVSVELAKKGVLDEYKVKMIGASLEAIEKAENRKKFRDAMKNINADLPESGFAYSVDECLKIAEKIRYPLIIRPSYTLGGTGSSIVHNEKELKHRAIVGLEASPINEVLIEECVTGWKEFEMEVMRDKADNAIIVCSIENLDPMGVHTGDSITIAPALTLSDIEYHKMRDLSIAILREIGVETGGSNVQFAVHPDTGKMVVIEMNPRVSRSSALASKATGFPIAKIAALLAVGYTLDEIPNDITKKTPACFEPTIDYVVTKIPRFTFEKFKGAKDELGTQMKSVGEVMAIGSTFLESLQKAVRGLEIKRFGLGADGLGQVKNVEEFSNWSNEKKNEYLQWVKNKLKIPNCDRIFTIKYALQLGLSIEEIYSLSKIDRWFINKINELVLFEKTFKQNPDIEKAKYYGYSDRQIAYLLNKKEIEIRNLREKINILPVYKGVDTCAGEFEAYTPYFYSTYGKEDEVPQTDKKKIAIIGGGPNRIGQGIEFDYCCVQAVMALKELNYEVIMINSNPETVSTDYDVADRLYFEPLTLEDVLNVLQREKVDGVIVQLGGQTPLNLARGLKENGITIIGTQPEAIDLAENRELFAKLLAELNIKQPENGIAYSTSQALTVARKIGYPVLVRPSYVLGGRAMEIVYNDKDLIKYIREAVEAQKDQPVLIDRFLEDATEVDVDSLCDGEEVFVAGVMEHIEHAGIHSGDSACVLPPVNLSPQIIKRIQEYTRILALKIGVYGLMNVQYAVKNKEVYVLEVNPRASRTVPYVSKSINIPLAKYAAYIMIGEKLKNLNLNNRRIDYYSVKEAVLPFSRFDNVDIILGPEMKSTGEVMAIDNSFGLAFLKAQEAAGSYVPEKGGVLLTVNNKDKKEIVDIAKELARLGFKLYATKKTAAKIKTHDIQVQTVKRVKEGGKGEILKMIEDGKIKMVINTPSGRHTKEDAYKIRRHCILYNIPIITTMSAAKSCLQGLITKHTTTYTVSSLQNRYRK